MSQDSSDLVAVIGIGCRLPGGIHTLESYWELLLNGHDASTNLASSSHNLPSFKAIRRPLPDRAYLLGEDPALFDAAFFNLRAEEAEAMDPQQRLLLEVTYEAMEAAGLRVEERRSSATSVFVGLMHGDYHDMQVRDPDSISPFMATGTARSCAANRLSHVFDWTGPSVTVDTACSSSLTALHYAIHSLRNGEATMAVAAGANLILAPDFFLSGAGLGLLSPTGRCRMWDSRADGYARGEGVAVVLLERLGDALRAGRHIEAVIRATGINQDGGTSTLTRPAPSSQTALIRETYRRAGLNSLSPSDRCHYFEAHGTGTPVGDPIEARAIRDAFFPSIEVNSPDDGRGDHILVGSAKTNIGHLESASGLAAVLKAILVVQHRIVPPNQHFHQLHAEVGDVSHGLRVPVQPQALRSTGTLRASVNSFGMGGANAHVIIESSPFLQKTRESLRPSSSSGKSVFFFSAKSEFSLRQMLLQYAAYLRRNPDADLVDLAWTLRYRKSKHTIRYACIHANSLELADHLEETARLPNPSFVSTQGHTRRPKIMGIFTGQGAQWHLMGRGLFQQSQVFRDSILKAKDVLESMGQQDFVTGEFLGQSKSRLGNPIVDHVLSTAVQIALVDLLVSAGVELDIVIGHSSGEIAAAYAAGYLSASDAVRVAYYRGRAIDVNIGLIDERPGGMIAVQLSKDEASAICSGNQFAHRLSLAASNSPESSTLSGDWDAIEEVQAVLATDGSASKILPVRRAYHSPHMKLCADTYMELLHAANIPSFQNGGSVTFVSSTFPNSTAVDTCESQSMYWTENLRRPVLFAEALHTAVSLAGGPDSFTCAIEVGPGATLRRPTLQSLGIDMPYRGLLQKGEDDMEVFMGTLAWLSMLNPALDLKPSFGCNTAPYDHHEPALLSGLPSYPWDHRQKYWLEPQRSQHLHVRSPYHELLGTSQLGNGAADVRVWRQSMSLRSMPWVSEHSVDGKPVFPSAGFCAMAIEAVRIAVGSKPLASLELHDVVFSGHIAFRIGEGGGGGGGGGEGPEQVLSTLENIVDQKILEPGSGSGSLQAVFRCEVIGLLGEPLKQVFSCKVYVKFGKPIPHLTPSCSLVEQRLPTANVDLDHYYSSLAGIGLSLTGMFRSLSSAQTRMNFASATTTSPLTHQAAQRLISLFAAAFQTFFLSFSSPGDNDMWTPFLPRTIKSVWISGDIAAVQTLDSVNLSEVYSQLYADRPATLSTGATIRGSVAVAQKTAEKQLLLALDDLRCSALANSMQADVRQLVSCTSWVPLLESGFDTQGVLKPQQDSSVIELCERLCYYYYHCWYETVPREKIATSSLHIKRLWSYLDRLFSSPNAQHLANHHIKSFDNDYVTTSNLLLPYADVVDVQLIHLVGQNLPDMIAGKVDLLDLMMRDKLLPKYYKFGLGLSECNAVLSAAAKQIAHRQPQLEILEVGAGTGATSLRVLDTLAPSLASYTFTDISPGFFRPARNLLDAHLQYLNFAVLDIENEDQLQQNFPDHKYDMLICANVLHATSDMKRTMGNVRRLLKPGGYLLLLEITGDLVRTGFMMAGLAGWWLGASDGRVDSPCLSQSAWQDLLAETGFSGIEQIFLDHQDPLHHTFSVIISRAVYDEVPTLSCDLTLLSKSELPTRKVVFIGDQESETAAIFDGLESGMQKLDGWDLQRVEEFQNPSCLDRYAFIICGGDSEHLEQRRNLHVLLRNACVILGVNTTDSASQLLAKCTGGIPCQFLDIDGIEPSRLQAQIILESLIRFMVEKTKSTARQALVTRSEESRIRWSGGKWWIPRIVAMRDINEAIHAARRSPVIRSAGESSHAVTAVYSPDGHISFAALKHSRAIYQDSVTLTDIETLCSTAVAFRVNPHAPAFMYLGYGRELGSKLTFLFLSQTNSSVTRVPSSWCIPVKGIASVLQMARFLDMIRCHIIIQVLKETTLSPGPVVILEPDSVLSSLVKAYAEGPKRMVCITSEESSKGPRLLKPSDQSFSEDASLVVDLSDNSLNAYKLVTNNVSQSCPKYSRSDIYRLGRAKSKVAGDLKISIRMLRAALDATLSYPEAEIAELKTKTITLGDEGSQAMRIEPSAVVQWPTSKASLITRILPTDSPSLFQQDRCYVLIGRMGIFARSWFQWLANSGCRHIIIISDAKHPHDIKAIASEHDIMLHASPVEDLSSITILQALRDISSKLAPIASILYSLAPFQDSSAAMLSNRIDTTTINDALSAELGYQPDSLINLVELVFDQGCLEFNHWVPKSCAQTSKNTVTLNLLIGPRRRDDQGHSITDLGLSERDLHQAFAEILAYSQSIPKDSQPGRIPRSEIFVGGSFPLELTGNEEWRDNPLFSHITVNSPNQASSLEPDVAKDRSAVACKKKLDVFLAGQGLECRDKSRLLDLICRYFTSSLLQDLLQLPTDSNETQTTLLKNLGVDSLVSIEIHCWFRDRLQVHIPVVEININSTVQDLCEVAVAQMLPACKSCR
ncbi:hypothetical protein WAI453_007430 [Rhynchosporium graminicola]